MPKLHQKQFPPMGNRENIVNRAQENCTVQSQLKIHQYFQVFHTNFKICFPHLVLLRNDFFLEDV